MNTELLKKIESRCEEVGDCLEWQGHISATGSPRIYHDSRMQSARKLMLQAHGKPSEVPLKHKLVCTCENHRCVNVDHIAIVPLAKFVRERLVPGTNHLLRSAKIAKARRAGAKLSAADVADIRASTEKDHILAERYGVSRAYVSSIQLHRRWRDHTISPWAGMGAR